MKFLSAMVAVLVGCSAILHAADFEPIVRGNGELYPAYGFGQAKVPSDPQVAVLGDQQGLVGVELVAPSDHAQVQVIIKGDKFIQPSSLTVKLPKKGQTYQIFPKARFDKAAIARLKQETSANISFLVKEAGQKPLQKTASVLIHPISDLPSLPVSTKGSPVATKGSTTATQGARSSNRLASGKVSTVEVTEEAWTSYELEVAEFTVEEDNAGDETADDEEEEADDDEADDDEADDDEADDDEADDDEADDDEADDDETDDDEADDDDADDDADEEDEDEEDSDDEDSDEEDSDEEDSDDEDSDDDGGDE